MTKEQLMQSITVSKGEAAFDVVYERIRQIEVEGHSPEEDDRYGIAQLSIAAECYLMQHNISSSKLLVPLNETEWKTAEASSIWPWSPAWWKPKSAREDLVRAAALIIAEIERLDRAAAKEPK